jgi:ABC-type polysaccharide/polyol phosphate export permease
MTRVVPYGLATLAIVHRDWRMFSSYRMQLVTQLVSTAFMLTFFYFVSRLVHVATFPTPGDYYAYVVVGMVILLVLTSTLSTPTGVLRQELVAGTFERMVLSPFGPVAGVFAMLFFPLAFTLVMGVVMLGLATALFSLSLEWPGLLLALPVAVLGALTFMPFGVLLASITLVFKQPITGASLIVGVLSLVAGVFFPAALLPGWIEWASHVQPLTPSVDLLRNLLVGTPLQDPAWISLVKLLGFAITVLPLSVLALVAAVRIGRTRGTIVET